MSETNEQCYIVSKSKLHRLLTLAVSYGVNEGSITERHMMKALEDCLEVPYSDPEPEAGEGG